MQGQSKAYRILHYKHNPEAAARQKLENERLLRLQAEVSALQKVVAQAKECQRTSNSQENIVAVVTNTEAEELRNEVRIFHTQTSQASELTHIYPVLLHVRRTAHMAATRGHGS